MNPPTSPNLLGSLSPVSPVSASGSEHTAPRRFASLDRLYGEGFVHYLQTQAHAMVVGVGGVGSWVAESLARSGVGRISLVDMDHVAESNINRQVQACDATLGQAKIQALAARIASFAPHCTVYQHDTFMSADNVHELLSALCPPHGVLLDCCDQARAKVAMAQAARALRLPLWMAGSAGGKTQPWRVQPADLRDSIQDPLLARVRQQLRKNAGFPRDAKSKLGVPVFFSNEPVQRPSQCQPEAGLNCAGYGSVVTVTAAMGMGLAAAALGYWQKYHKK